MNSNRTLVRWGALALLVTLMSGCCVAPWGGRYYHVANLVDPKDLDDGVGDLLVEAYQEALTGR